MRTPEHPVRPAPSTRPRSSLALRLVVAVALAASIVAATGAASSASATASGSPRVAHPPVGSDREAAAPGEVVLGRLATTRTPPRTATRPSTASAPGSVTASAGAPAAGHSAVDDLKGGPGCSIACITSGIAYARGPGARLVVRTDGTPVFMRILVSGPGYLRSQDSADGVTSFGADFLDLESGTEYQGLVTVWDAQGFAQVRVGTFTTLERNIELEVTHAVLLATPYGDDSITARFWVDDILMGDQAGLDPAGDVLAIGPHHVHDADRTHGEIDLAVELTQSDEGADLCEHPPNADGPDAGAYDCSRWISALSPEGGIDLDDRPADASSWVEWQIETALVIPGDGGYPPGFGEPFAFSVPVLVTVTYT